MIDNYFRKQNIALFLLAAASLFVGGCTSDVAEIEDLQSVSLFSTDDQLPRTMSYIQSIQRYDQEEFQKNIVSGLVRWHKTFRERNEQVEWQPPSLLDTLPTGVQNWRALTELPNESFVPEDANYLQEVYWMETIGRRVVLADRLNDFNGIIEIAKSKMTAEQLDDWGNSSDLLGYVLHILNPELSPPPVKVVTELSGVGVEDNRLFGEGAEYLETGSQKLAAALRLFDWTIRNAQARVPAAWPTPAEVARQTTFDVAFSKMPDWPPAAGVAGPGYTRFPWQVLTYGKGDYLERANLFLGLLEHAGLDAVMLAVPTVNETSMDHDGHESIAKESARPYEEWLVGVSIDEEIYLFDTELGIAFPGQEMGRIATLAEVIRNPELISNLSLSVDESIEEINYRVQHGRLQQVFALVRIAPEAMSKRMTLLERSLTGDNRLKLTHDISSLVTKLESNDLFSKVQLWHLPFSVHQYRDTINSALARMAIDREVAEKMRWHFPEEGYIDVFASFRSVKNIYLHGRFNTPRNDTRLNALEGFNRFTYSDEEISTFENDIMLQTQLGIYQRAGQSFNEWQSQLALVKDQMKRIRADAAFHTALAHYENGLPDTALNWLTRIDRYDEEARWLSAANYQSARAHEAIGEYDQAVQIYRRKGSPQRYGNVIRARLLEYVSALKSSS